MLGLLLIASQQVAQTPAPPVLQISFQDSNGKRRAITGTPDQRGTVMFLMIPDCPIARQYAAEMERIRKEYAPKKIQTFTVIADPDYTPARSKLFAKEYGIGSPVILTSKNRFTFSSGQAISPTAIVISNDGQIVYRGRIDDRYPKLGVQRKPRRRDLRIALDQFLASKPVSVPQTKAVGCIIPPEFLKGRGVR
jgi:hypothetical protein